MTTEGHVLDKDTVKYQDILTTASQASNRTRAIVVSMVIASILVLAGLLNSLQSHWMRQRWMAVQDIDGESVQMRLGKSPVIQDAERRAQDPHLPKATEEDKQKLQAAQQLYRDRYLALYGAFARQYIETTYTIKVPFFGVTFDVNDLGLIGGIGFLVILILFGFCLAREEDNLRFAFEAVKARGELLDFYNLLAMTQVFTVPQSSYVRHRPWLVWVPKVICCFPLAAYTAVFIHDLLTIELGRALGRTHVVVVAVSEVVLLMLISILTFMVTSTMIQIDSIWARYWDELQKPPTSTETRK